MFDQYHVFFNVVVLTVVCMLLRCQWKRYVRYKLYVCLDFDINGFVLELQLFFIFVGKYWCTIVTCSPKIKEERVFSNMYFSYNSLLSFLISCSNLVTDYMAFRVTCILLFVQVQKANRMYFHILVNCLSRTWELRQLHVHFGKIEFHIWKSYWSVWLKFESSTLKYSGR